MCTNEILMNGTVYLTSYKQNQVQKINLKPLLVVTSDRFYARVYACIHGKQIKKAIYFPNQKDFLQTIKYVGVSEQGPVAQKVSGRTKLTDR